MPADGARCPVAPDGPTSRAIDDLTRGEVARGDNDQDGIAAESWRPWPGIRARRYDDARRVVACGLDAAGQRSLSDKGRLLASVLGNAPVQMALVETPIAMPRRSASAAAALNRTSAPVVAGSGRAFPATQSQRELWTGFFAEHYGAAPLAQRIWERCGVDRRHGVIDPRVEDLSGVSVEERMRRFNSAGGPLAVEAVKNCLIDAGVAASDVRHLTITTCTGYGSPGIEIDVVRDLGLDARVQRLHVRDMGCYAAIPSMAATSDAVKSRGGVGVLLCLELPSLHIQPPTDDPAQVVAHALFSDAAVAIAMVPGNRGDADCAVPAEGSLAPDASGMALQLVDMVSFTEPESAALMSWDVTSLGFRMRLSPAVPVALKRHVRAVVGELLAHHDLTVDDVCGWAVHPGGPAILDVIEDRLDLPSEALRESRVVLREHGNCSSATVLLVLERIRRERELEDGDAVVAMAFGPGLTLYVALLRATVAEARPVTRQAGGRQ